MTRQSELGDVGTSRIASIDVRPLSTASIAQVHAARLTSGAKVVIKLQHPEVAAMMLQDIQQAEVLGRVLAAFEPDFDFTSLIKEANAEHIKELNFHNEAANLAEVRANLQRSCVVAEVPAPVIGLVSERVLVMTFSTGISLKSRPELLAAGIDLQLLVARVCEAWAAQMFTHGIFNADPHPGNILVRNEDGVGPLPVLLDFGLCKRLTEESRLSFCRMVHALTETDGDMLIQALVSLGLKMNVEIDPFEALASLMFAFRNTESDEKISREAMRKQIGKQEKRGEVYREIGKERKKKGEKAPLEALSSELIYFLRTVDMLQVRRLFTIYYLLLTTYYWLVTTYYARLTCCRGSALASRYHALFYRRWRPARSRSCCIHTHTYTYIHTYCVCMYVHRVYVCTCVYMYVCMYMCIYVRMYVYRVFCMYVCMCTCGHAYMHPLHAYSTYTTFVLLHTYSTYIHSYRSCCSTLAPPSAGSSPAHLHGTRRPRRRNSAWSKYWWRSRPQEKSLARRPAHLHTYTRGYKYIRILAVKLAYSYIHAYKPTRAYKLAYAYCILYYIHSNRPA